MFMKKVTVKDFKYANTYILPEKFHRGRISSIYPGCYGTIERFPQISSIIIGTE